MYCCNGGPQVVCWDLLLSALLRKSLKAASTCVGVQSGTWIRVKVSVFLFMRC